ncbi:hypothetical protein [Bacillus cereus]|uniref:hypothetical protein n=1 Tax=Bacillus cereus TaxID=1396 RepID=UPI001D0E38ED|nr:hypothetical protein [Bacillus cereus]MCC2383519.1 hypothetical protein [Bacillus cereus]
MNELQQAKRLEEEVKMLRERHRMRVERKSWIHVGVLIFDEDAKKLAKVSGLEKGCIDFSADYVDGSYSRGYHYTVSNWRLATFEEKTNYEKERRLFNR